MSAHLWLEASWKVEKEEKIQKNRKNHRHLMQTAGSTNLRRKENVLQPRVGRKLLSAPQRCKMNEARNGDLKTAARLGGI